MSTATDALSLRQTPLMSEHQKLQAKIAPFSGWQMPIQYAGIIKEHLHTRSKASVFDVCHMGEFIVHGADACADLEKLLTLRVSDLSIGKCRYGFLLNDQGCVIDDLLLFRIDMTRFMVVVNAGTFQTDANWIIEHLSENTCFEDVSLKMAKIDLQGPESLKVFEEVFEISLDHLHFYSFKKYQIYGIDILVSRTGYTGERGIELFFDSLYTVDIWNRIMAHPLVKPAGLGARDTLRLEMGYSLYGQDLSRAYTPFQSQLERFVCLDKEFIGKDQLLKQLETGVYPVLVAFKIQGKRSARKGFSVYKDIQKIGIVSSASYSPSLGYSIGLAYIDPEYTNLGEQIFLKSDKVELEGEIVTTPFYKEGTLKLK